MNTSELVAKIAEAHSVSKTQAQAIVDSMLKTILGAAAVNAHRNGTLDVRRKGTPLRGLVGLSHDTRNWIPCLTKNGALLS